MAEHILQLKTWAAPCTSPFSWVIVFSGLCSTPVTGEFAEPPPCIPVCGEGNALRRTLLEQHCTIITRGGTLMLCTAARANLNKGAESWVLPPEARCPAEVACTLIGYFQLPHTPLLFSKQTWTFTSFPGSSRQVAGVYSLRGRLYWPKVHGCQNRRGWFTRLLFTHNLWCSFPESVLRVCINRHSQAHAHKYFRHYNRNKLSWWPFVQHRANGSHPPFLLRLTNTSNPNGVMVKAANNFPDYRLSALQ